MKTYVCWLFFICTLLAVPVTAGDWPAFRGPRGDGYADGTPAPIQWSQQKNIRWKAALPQPGNSSPIVSNGRVFVTCAEDPKGMKRSLYCFDRVSGKQLWVRTVEYDKQEKTHDTNPYCGSTPAADGKRVIAWHGSAGLYCYDLEGNVVWERKLADLEHIWGDGTSPIIYQDQVIVNCGPGPRVFVTALDLKNGKTIWNTDEPIDGDGSHRSKDKAYMGSWTTPIIARVDGRERVICAMPTRVVGYDLMTGKIAFWCEGISGAKGDLAYSSPVISDNVLVTTGGFGGPAIGFTLGGKGDLTKNRLWRTEQNPQSIGSGVAIDGYYYRPNAGPGTIECIDPKTGKTIWTDRAGGGEYWGSIVYAGDVCYVTNQVGQTVVFRPNPQKFEIVAKNDLGEPSNATPAIADGQIFLRTHQGLYCVAEK